MLEDIFGILGLVPEGGKLGVVPSIELSVIAAAVLALVFFRLRQPALLAYIVAGLVLGLAAKPAIGSSMAVMEQISHLGLILLLFIIGLEMDLKGIFELGARTASSVLLQAPLTISAVWAAFIALDRVGVEFTYFGSNTRAWFFFATAAGLSSTAVTVKLLASKYELTTQAGKVTVLTLIAQDIWAVLALSYASSFKDATESHSAWLVILGAAVAAGAMVILSRFVLSRVVVAISRSPELVALAALGWCFVGSAMFSNAGLSAEMGALVAGLTLGILPTSTEVLAKVSSLRDFFMALFFVALGISLPPPTLGVIAAAAVLVVVVVVTRLLLFAPLLMLARSGPQVAFTASINLAQISEFALLLVPVGVATGALSETEGSVISYGMMISVLVSTYGVKYNDTLARKLSVLAPSAATRHSLYDPTSEAVGSTDASILVLGYHDTTRALVSRLAEQRPELVAKIRVIDINLKNHSRIRSMGVRVEYGDVSNPETLRHQGIDHATVVLSTIEDTYLRGTSNLRLLELAMFLNPRIRFIGTASTPEQKQQLLVAGAFGAVCPAESAAPDYEELISVGLAKAPGV